MELVREEYEGGDPMTEEQIRKLNRALEMATEATRWRAGCEKFLESPDLELTDRHDAAFKAGFRFAQKALTHPRPGNP